jgi:uncharacterized OsmC-like protein
MYRVNVINTKDYNFTVHSDTHEFVISPEGKAISPPSVLLASLASCIGVYIRKYADGTEMKLGEFSVAAEAEFSKEQPICFRAINIIIDLKNTRLDEKRKESLIRFIKNCPVHNTLKNSPEINLVLG